jgi:glycosyltransferase involved in cell wall biosynthesis
MGSSKRLKIIQVTTFFTPVVGGVETQVEDLCRQLQAEGHEVEVLTTDSGRAGVRLTRESKDQEIGGIKVTRVRSFFSFSQFHRFAPGFFSELMKRDFDVVHVHGLRKLELFLALLAAKLKRKRIVVSTHNPFTTVGRGRLSKLLIILQDLFLGAPFLRFVDKYLLLGESEKVVLRRFGIKDKQMQVVGNAINAEFFQKVEVNREEFLAELEVSQRKQWQLVVLMVGRLNVVKGFQYLREAVAELDHCLFILVGGDDGYGAELRRLYADMDNFVLIDNFISRADLLRYYAAADVFLLPSVHEPFGIVLLEAMAQGKAVLATDNGGPVEILGQGEFGRLLRAPDESAWTQNLQDLNDNPDKLGSLQRKAKTRAKQFKWEEILPLYLKAYKS